MNNIMSTLYRATEPAVLNMESNGTLWSVSPRASAGTLRVKWP